MKISIVGPGIMPIPPTGWGAVEILIWDQKLALEKLGHQVDIVNTKSPIEIIQKINEYRPDFVHVQYDDFIELYPYIQYPCAITSHFGYLEQPNKWGYYHDRIVKPFQRISPVVFCLSDGIRNVYKNELLINEDNLLVTPNGVNTSKFVTRDPKYPDRSLYLAKIDYRKRQSMFQSISSLYYAGNNADPNFNVNINYLGEWSKEYLYNNLTDYGNLVLLSDGEAHPLVCMEALAAGLGVVVCEYGAANLDTSKDFITVIPENKIRDLKYLEDEIIKNRDYSISHKDDIIKYASNFDWLNVIRDRYIPCVEKIIERKKG
jgi:glycosyltransferase involved in cell wall biosynthesis